MDYLHTNANAAIRYHTSDMILKVVYDSALLFLPETHSRAAAIYHLVLINNNKHNGLIDVFFQTIKNFVASSIEAEMGGIYLCARHWCPICIACIDLGNPQPVNGTPFENDNSTSHIILTSNIRSKLSKSFDMWYWWINDRIKQNTFDPIWAAGKKNAADYYFEKFSINLASLFVLVYKTDMHKLHQPIRGFVQVDTAETWIKPMENKLCVQVDLKSLQDHSGFKVNKSVCIK